jgi:hypothetical protein
MDALCADFNKGCRVVHECAAGWSDFLGRMVDGSSGKIVYRRFVRAFRRFVASSLRGCRVSDSGVDELATYKARLGGTHV